MERKPTKEEEYRIGLIRKDVGLYFKYLERKHIRLLKNIKQQMPKLEELLGRIESHSGEEDLVYRFYHHSSKTPYIQDFTSEIYDLMKKISPYKTHEVLDTSFNNIVNIPQKQFEKKDLGNYEKAYRPMMEAFFHSKYFLKMAVKYGKEFQKPPHRCPSGWAAILELYNLMI